MNVSYFECVSNICFGQKLNGPIRAKGFDTEMMFYIPKTSQFTHLRTF
jgi:hypothetical protein